MMQSAPDAALADADRSAYASLLAEARAACAGDTDFAGVAEADALTSVAALHRSAGLVEHELLRSLAEEERGPGDEVATAGMGS
jgi:hypothetical protein